MTNNASSNVTVLPAFGRDYKSKKAMLEDFKNNKDFEHRNLDGFLSSGIANIDDFASDSAWSTLQFRYKDLAETFLISRAQLEEL